MTPTPQERSKAIQTLARTVLESRAAFIGELVAPDGRRVVVTALEGPEAHVMARVFEHVTRAAGYTKPRAFVETLPSPNPPSSIKE